MTTREIIESAVTYLGLSGSVGSDGGQSEDRQLLLKCVRIILDEIATEYLPIKVSQEAEVVDGKIEFANLLRQPVRIRRVRKDGKDVRFCNTPSAVQVDAEGTVSVEYNAFPATAASEDETVETGAPLAVKSVAAGVCSQYCLVRGMYEQSLSFSEMFKEDMRTACRSVREIRVKGRRWL